MGDTTRLPCPEDANGSCGQSRRTRPRLLVRLTFWALMLVVLGVVLEIGARTYYALNLSRILAPHALSFYQQPDPEHQGNWLLKPNRQWTLGDVMEEYQSQGRTLTLANLEESANRQGASCDRIVLRINRHGFRGPDLDARHARPRIVCVGDSCTFGGLDQLTYPQVIQQSLAGTGLPVEVVNAGVEGYAPANALTRFAAVESLHPEIVTIYLGWNAFWSDNPANSTTLSSVRLFRGAARRILGGSDQQRARASFSKQKSPRSDDPLLAAYEAEDYQPSGLADLKTLAIKYRAAGSRVVLVTLPGLYTMDPPSRKALKIGHLAEFTSNPYVLAKVTERFNTELRALAADAQLMLIDLDQWSRQALVPRDAYFIDSVHLTALGQKLIGQFMAQQLEALVRQAWQAERFASQPRAARAR